MSPLEYQEWIKTHIPDPVLMDDKSRLYEYLDILSSDESPIIYKEFALKGLGMIAMKYNSDPIILCGALPLIKEQLLSSHPTLISQSIRTLTFIADNNGKDDIIQEEIHILIRSIISEREIPQNIKNMGLKFYFKILDTPLDNLI
jgi:hypothetical protein